MGGRGNERNGGGGGFVYINRKERKRVERDETRLILKMHAHYSVVILLLLNFYSEYLQLTY